MLPSGGLPDALTVAKAVDLHAGYFGRRLPSAEGLEAAGLTALARRRCGRLSGGEQRRVQFALAIAGSPDLLTLNEPTTGFDPESRRALWHQVRARAKSGAAVLLATHHMDEAEALADRILVIAGGRSLADGPPAAIKAQVAATTPRLRTALSPARLSALPDVVRMKAAGADMRLITARARRTLKALFAADPALADFKVANASLEDALAHLLTTAKGGKEAARHPPSSRRLRASRCAKPGPRS